MTTDYPDDIDGAELRRVIAAGANMSQPMVIDFAVDVPDETIARSIADVVVDHGFDPSIYEDTDHKKWHVFCAKSLLATYEGIVAERVALNAVVGPLGGRCDGWGTFGN